VGGGVGNCAQGPGEGEDRSREGTHSRGKDTGAKENTGRAVKLRYHYTLCTIDHKGAARCHIGDRPKIHVLDLRLEVYVLRVITREL